MFFSLAFLLGAAAAASIDEVNTILSETSLSDKPMLSPYAVGERDRKRKNRKNFFFFFFSPFSTVVSLHSSL
jgi:hypothetical protein